MTARQRNYSKFGICIPRTKILSFKVSLLIGCRPEVERGVAHLVVHGTTGSTSYETIPPVPPETSGGVLSTVDMVVQRRDGRRRICDNDVDDDERSGPPTFTRCRRFPEPESWHGSGQTAGNGVEAVVYMQFAVVIEYYHVYTPISKCQCFSF